MRKDLGTKDGMAVVADLVRVKDRSLVDVGCGPGIVAAKLAEMGATVLGVEPDPVQAEKNKAAPDVANVTLLQAGGEALPVEDAAVDGVFFFKSLHHVPRDLMDQALREAARVLKPDGFLYVEEPGMTGSHFQMMRPFHDETEVRTLAQQALARTASKLFSDCTEVSYTLYPRHDDFEAMIGFHTAMSFNSITRDMIDVPEVRKSFEAAKTDDGYVFEQPMLVNVYRGLKN